MKNWPTALKKFIESLRSFNILKHKAFSEKYLLGTNIIISWALSSLGDILEQKYERYAKRLAGKKVDFDFIRTRNMGIGGCTAGIVSHYGYMFLDNKFPGRSYGTVITKTLLDQLIFSPISILVLFLTLNIIERKSVEEFLIELKTKAWRLYKAEWLVWPVAQFINFYWLPANYRVFYDNVISLGFDIYTSRVMHVDENSDD